MTTCSTVSIDGFDIFYLEAGFCDHLYSCGTNSPLYPQWQEYFRRYQPPTSLV
jgi:hypothetical protein